MLPVFSRPSPTWVSATSTVTVCLPVVVSVFADTVAPFLPTNSTSAAFFTAAWNALLVSSVVLSDESTQPKPRKSPTVAAVLLATVVPPAPVAELVKLTKSFLASLPLYLVKPLVTLVIALLPALMPSLVTLIGAAVVPVAPAAGVMVKPSLSITVFAPFSVPKVTLVKPVKVSFSE